MNELGDAINNSLSESESIARIMARLKDEGYDVFLALQATIGFNRREDEDRDEQPDASSAEPVGALRLGSEPEFAVNANDLRFLKALRINADETR